MKQNKVKHLPPFDKESLGDLGKVGLLRHILERTERSEKDGRFSQTAEQAQLCCLINDTFTPSDSPLCFGCSLGAKDGNEEDHYAECIIDESVPLQRSTKCLKQIFCRRAKKEDNMGQWVVVASFLVLCFPPVILVG